MKNKIGLGFGWENSLNRQIARYLETHFMVTPGGSKFNGMRAAQFYSSILEHMLVDHNLVPKEKSKLEQSFKKLFNKKTVLEIGCRDGAFLKFAKDHGAKIIGTTSGEHFEKAKDNLREEKAKIFNSTAQEAYKHVKKENPDFVISFNIFDKIRWSNKEIKPEELLEKISRTGKRKTWFYIHPSTDTASILEDKHFGMVPGIKEVDKPIEHYGGFQRDSRLVTCRFRIE